MTAEKPQNLPDPTTDYARDVTEGRISAGPLVRAACARHLRDKAEFEERLAAGIEHEGIWWSAANADKVFRFFERVLRLTGGEHEGRPFILHPAQKFIVGSLFGWMAPDGYRRFRVAFIEMGKGNGKSPLAAGIGLYMLTADREPRAEVYSAAVDKDQAKILFRDAVAMVKQSPSLMKRCRLAGGEDREYNIAFRGSWFRPISSEHKSGSGKSGPRPHCILLDEVHEHPSNKMVELMRAGTKGRRQALCFMITNSGVYDTSSVAWNYHERAERIMNQQDADDSFFAYVCGLDKGDVDSGILADDWKDSDPAIRLKANPLLGVSVTPKYLDEQVREAIGMPSKQSIVRRLSFCEWVGSENPFVTPELWRANGGTYPLELLKGRECYGGLDLSSKNDLSALVLVFPLDDGKKAVLPFFWKATDTLREHGDRDHAPYQQWAKDGHLLTTPGKVIGYDFIAKELDRLSGLYDIKGVAYDKWKIEEFQAECESVAATLQFYPHSQGFSGGALTMSASITALEDDLKNGLLLHGNHPIQEWCVSNAKITQDAAENRKFDKRKQTGRIDGASALAMAEGLAKRESLVDFEPQFFVLGGG